MPTRNDPVFIGPLPPPVHGSSVMTEYLFEVVARHTACKIINSSSSAEVTSVGKLGARNVLGSLRTIGTSARLLTRRRPLVYLAPSQIGPALIRDLLLWSLASIRSDHLLIHVHGCGFHRLGIAGPRLRRALVRRLAKRSHFILLGERYGPVFLQGIPRPLALSYLPNAIPALAEQALKRPPTRCSGSTIRLLYVGAVSRPKLWDGLKTIVRSPMVSDELKRSRTRLCIVIAGQFHGPGAAEELHRICSLATDPVEIEYLGAIYDLKTKSRIFASADCFFLPSMHPTEGLPVTLIEALCAGLPIIAFDTGLCGDVVTDRNGWLVPRGDFRRLEASVLDFLRCRNRNELGERVAASRSLFNERFSPMAFEKRALEIITSAGASVPS